MKSPSKKQKVRSQTDDSLRMTMTEHMNHVFINKAPGYLPTPGKCTTHSPYELRLN